MFELIHRIPDPWRQLTDVLIAPLAWIPVMQHTLWDFFFAPGPWWLLTGKYIFLVFPALLAVAAVWCTQLSLYTLPFRSARVQFIPTMMPTLPALRPDLFGGQSSAHYSAPVLECFLRLLGLGSFACVQSLMDALKKKDFKSIIQMLIVELFVMFFEVMFLYRELIDALTPWISQQTGMKMGLTFTLALSAFGWIGIRGMTWFLFGQYGTPPMLAFISRQPIVDEDDPRLAAAAAKPAPAWWRQPVEELKKEIDWLHAKSEELLDYLRSEERRVGKAW